MKTSKQKRFAAAFAGMLCISCLTTPFSAAAEDTGITGENDTIAAAEEMPLNTAVSGEISTKGDVDYYKITLPEDGTLQIGLTAGWVSDFGDSYCITLYDADGTEISKDDYIYSNTPFPADGRTAGVYYLSLAPHYADYPPTSTYTVTANFTPKSQWEADCAYELEPNDSFNTASPLALSAACQGVFHNYQDADYYTFTTDQPGKLSVTLRDDMQSSNSLGWSLFLYNHDRKQIGKASLTKGTASVTIPEQGFDPGTFYIQVKTNDMTSRNWSYADQYTITADFTPTDSTYESEPNDTRSDADSLLPNASISGKLADASDVDFFATSLQDRYSRVTLQFQHDLPETLSDSSQTPWCVSLYCYHAETQTIDTVPIQTWNIPLGTGSFTTDSFLAKSGTYYTKVSCPGTNNYPELEYTLTVEAVGIPYEKGDVDQDHAIGINDAFLALSAYATVSAGGEMPLQDAAFLAADIDEDSEITIQDAFGILKYYSVLSAGGNASWDNLQ